MYSKEIADRHINFIRYLRHTIGRWSGVPFCMLDWQEEILREVFGSVDDAGKRITKQLYLHVAKKNGKSEMCAAIALDLLLNDDEDSAEIYSAAADRDQAAIVFKVAADMVRQDSALEKRLKIIDSQRRIVHHKTSSIYRVISSDAFTKHGYNISGLLFDELHSQPNRELYDTLTEGAGDAREQPLFVFMTTAGYDKNSICYEVYDYAKKVRDGLVDDPSFYPAVFELDDKDNWEDPKVWPKANPSLGHIFNIDKLDAGYKKAKEVPARQNTFRRLRLNQWTEQEVKWLDAEKWNACKRKIKWADFEGKPCYVGMDLASTLDITALVLNFQGEDGIYIKPYFWIPEENMRERVKRDRVPYDLWVRQGLIRVTEGNVIDYDQIHVDFNEIRAIYRFTECAYDPWNAQQLVNQLVNEGANMVPIAQTMKHMGPPTKLFEEFILKQAVFHDGNPVLNWMIGNVSVRVDGEGNYKPDKNRSKEKIDGVVAGIMGFDRLTLSGKKSSVYSSRGILSIGE